MISTILSILSAIVTLYTILCFIAIVMTWIPGAKFTKFGRFISSVCDPYLNFFSRFNWLRIANIDFSPIISIGLLSILSAILSGIQRTGRIWFGGILATVIQMLWSAASSILGIFFLLVLIRWIVLLFQKGRTSFDSGWNQVDQLLNKFSYKVASTFTKSSMSYQKSLLITWIVFGFILVAGAFLINILAGLCSAIPF